MGGGRGRGGGHRGGGNREMDRPWVTPGLRQEMLKTKSLASVARKAKSAEAVVALGEQQERKEAKVHWLARHPEHEQAWLNVLAEEERWSTHFCDVCERPVGSLEEQGSSGGARYLW